MGILNWLLGKDKPTEIYSKVEVRDGGIITQKVFSDGSWLVESETSEPFKTYFRLSDKIKTARDIHSKLAACEASFKILPEFVRLTLADWGKLPDTILCRDEAPKLYLRLGQWTKARAAVEKCIAAGAYDDGGAETLAHVERYERTARIAIDFLRGNPGFAQNKIYGALPEADRDCLKEFTRSSLLIRKERTGNTNKIFLRRELHEDNGGGRCGVHADFGGRVRR